MARPQRRRRTTMRRLPPKKKPAKKKKRTSSTASVPKTLARTVADFIMPHINVPPVRMPDGQNAETLQIVTETTGLLQPNGYDAGDNFIDGLNCSVWFPGDITTSHYLNPILNSEGGPGITPGVPTITGLGTGSDSSDKTTIANDCESFRVTGATLKIEYIGGNMDNGGEIILKKFDPATFDNDGATSSNPRTISNIPRTIDEYCKSTKYLSAKDGAFVVFGQSDSTEFETFGQPLNANSAASHEGLVVFLQGCDQDVQSWRFVLTQSIEIRPQKNTFLARVAKQPPPDMPLFRTAMNMVQHAMSRRNMDMTEAKACGDVYLHCIQCCMQALKEASGQTGYGIPKLIGSALVSSY